jgi:hypothetical protein
MTRTSRAGPDVPMHDFHVHRWKYVIDEANVIFSKLATVHLQFVA